jgi:hypothetical protein
LAEFTETETHRSVHRRSNNQSIFKVRCDKFYGLDYFTATNVVQVKELLEIILEILLEIFVWNRLGYAIMASILLLIFTQCMICSRTLASYNNSIPQVTSYTLTTKQNLLGNRVELMHKEKAIR